MSLHFSHHRSPPRSLEDYERKVLTGHKAQSRYSQPLQLFWERDRNDVFSPIAADYACRVRALMGLAKAFERNDDIPGRPKPWNETHEEA